MALLDLIARIRLHTSQYDAALAKTAQKTESTMARVSKSISTKLAGAFTATAALGWIKQLAAFGDKMDTLAKQTQTTTDQIQFFNFVASRTGISVEEIANAFKGLAKARLEALSGAPGNRQETFFGRLGINKQELGALNDMTQLGLRAFTSMRGVKEGADRLALVQEIFKEAGVKTLPLVTANLAELSAQFERMGGALTPDEINKLARMAADFKTMGIVILNVTAPAISELVGRLQSMFDILDKISNKKGGAIDVLRRIATGTLSSLLKLPIPLGLPGARGDSALPPLPEAGLFGGDFAEQARLMEFLSSFPARGKKTAPGDILGTRPGSPIFSDELTSVGNYLGGGNQTARHIESQSRNVSTINMNVQRLKDMAEQRPQNGGGVLFP